jgi:asparagine synthase (glutamine-hydrolysing)
LTNDANRSALERMGAAMRHRGPDGERTWVSPPDREGLGCLFLHRRLAILDLTDFAAQPMVDPARNHVIVFNGEIYNYNMLRDELVAAGENFDSTGDTAVMLRALALWGAPAVKRLRGMFAFGLWDPDTRQLTLSRDPLGIKPLYLCRNPDPVGSWRLAFASEVRALLASGLMKSPALDPVAVASVVWNGFVMGPGTIVKGIEHLWPGQVVTFDGVGRQLSTTESWRYSPENGKTCDEQELRLAIRESVKEHLISDVPLGVFLSGGVDSSAIANLAQRVSGGPIDTFTVTFDESEYDEGPIAKKIAGMIGTRHHEFRLSETVFRSGLEAAVGSLDQPSFDGINSYFVSKTVKEAGLTVALSGTGGDELFGGYESFDKLPRLFHLLQKASWAPEIIHNGAAHIAGLFSGSSGGAIGAQTGWAKLPDMIRRGADIIGLYQLVYSLFRPDFQRLLLDDPFTALRDGLPETMCKRLADEIADQSPLAAVSILEQRCFLGERLLRDTDAASMAVSLETRLPLVDRVLAETVARLPDDLRFLPLRRKQLLRKVGLEGLDLAIFNRPKSGFVLPFNTWIRRGLIDTIARTLLAPDLCRGVGLNPKTVAQLWEAFQSGQRGFYWSRIWSIYVLIRWSTLNNLKLAEVQ